MRAYEKIEVPANVRHGMEKPLAYLFARADKGGAGWIGRLDAPKGETFGGILFYAEKGASVWHVMPLAETEGKMGMELWPICRWTSERQDDHSEVFLAYMPPATAYCVWRRGGEKDGVAALVVPTTTLPQADWDERWWARECRRLWRWLHKGANVEELVPRFGAYRAEVESEKIDMLVDWRMGERRPRHGGYWRLDWMVSAGASAWDILKRWGDVAPARGDATAVERDNPAGRRLCKMVRKEKRRIPAPTT